MNSCKTGHNFEVSKLGSIICTRCFIDIMDFIKEDKK